MGTLYKFLDNTTHYKTKSVHFLGLMNSATKLWLSLDCSAFCSFNHAGSRFACIDVCRSKPSNSCQDEALGILTSITVITLLQDIPKRFSVLMSMCIRSQPPPGRQYDPDDTRSPIWFMGRYSMVISGITIILMTYFVDL